MNYETQLIPALQRLIDSKAAIIAAIAAKGVTVPADASLEDLAALVQAIEGGGTGLTIPEITNQIEGLCSVESGLNYLFKESDGTLSIQTGKGRTMKGTNNSSMYASDIDKLTNTATAADVASGKLFWGRDGKQTTGTKVESTLPTLSNPATEGDILTGKQAIDSNGNLLTGSLVDKDLSFITAGAEQILSGYVGSDAEGNPVNGTRTVQVTLFDPPITYNFIRYNENGFYPKYNVDLSAAPDADYYAIFFDVLKVNGNGSTNYFETICALLSKTDIIFSIVTWKEGAASSCYEIITPLKRYGYPNTKPIANFNADTKMLITGGQGVKDGWGNSTLTFNSKYFFAIKL